MARLEAPERAAWQKPDEIVSRLDLQEGAVVAEIGPGTGYFTVRLAAAVGPKGRIHALDLQAEMRAALKERLTAAGIDHVDVGGCGPVETGLEDASVDLVFLANLTHEYDDLTAGLRECARITRPGGRIVVVDWKAEEMDTGPPLDHRVSEETVIGIAEGLGLSLSASETILPYHYFLLFGV
jgi:ubiquinone/menaquinone biosynthesis C-methylase UbiE